MLWPRVAQMNYMMCRWDKEPKGQLPASKVLAKDIGNLTTCLCISNLTQKYCLVKLFEVLWHRSWPPLLYLFVSTLLVRKILFFSSIISWKLWHNDLKSWNSCIFCTLRRWKIYKTHEIILRCAAENRQVDVSAVISGLCQTYGLGIPLTKTHASWVSMTGTSLISMNVHSESFPDCPAWQSVSTWWCWAVLIHSKYLPCHFPPCWDCSTCHCQCKRLLTGGRVLRVFCTVCVTALVFLSWGYLTGYLWQISTYTAMCKQQHCLCLKLSIW